jgi:hypothetical protein
VAVKARFEQTMANLDTGGDLLLVTDVSGLLEGLVTHFQKLATFAADQDPDAARAGEVLERVTAFLDKSGVYALRGLGVSSVPRPGGGFDTKAFINRDAKAAELPLWRALCGSAPRVLKGTAFLPAGTVLAGVDNAELGELWPLLRAGVREIAPPEAAAAFDAWASNQTARLGVSLDALATSLGDETLLAVVFAPPEKKPAPGAPAAGPALPFDPALLLGLAVRDAKLQTLILTQLKQAGTPSMTNQVGETAVYTVPVPVPAPFPVQPSFATHKGMFLAGSSLRVVTEAIEASEKGGGLAADKAFQAAFAGLPEKNNGLTYISQDFGKDLIQLMASVGGGGGEGADALLKLLGESPPRSFR